MTETNILLILHASCKMSIMEWRMVFRMLGHKSSIPARGFI